MLSSYGSHLHTMVVCSLLRTSCSMQLCSTTPQRQTVPMLCLLYSRWASQTGPARELCDSVDETFAVMWCMSGHVRGANAAVNLQAGHVMHTTSYYLASA